MNALVDDPIVGKSEESPRVFPFRGGNNVAVASLVASDSPSPSAYRVAFSYF